MYRRKLILRRFGAMSFGLGYFDQGRWVDHAPGDGLVAAADPDMQAVHAWLGCCSRGAESLAIPTAIAADVQERIAVLARSAPS